MSEQRVLDTRSRRRFVFVLVGDILGLYAPIELGRLIYIYATEWGTRPFFIVEYLILAVGVSLNLWVLWHLSRILWRQ